jgi:hypothetical protein
MQGNSWLADQLFACQVLCHVDLDKSTGSVVETPFNIVEVFKWRSKRSVKQDIAVQGLRAFDLVHCELFRRPVEDPLLL